MKKYLVYFFLLSITSLFSQNRVSGFVIDNLKKPIKNAQLYSETNGFLTETDSEGKFEFITELNQISLIIYADNFKLYRKVIQVEKNSNLEFVLDAFEDELSEIEIKVRKEKIFELKTVSHSHFLDPNRVVIEK